MKMADSFKLKYRHGGLLNMSTINYINNREYSSLQEKIEYTKRILCFTELRDDWCSTPMEYERVVDTILDMYIFIRSYEEMFPKSKKLISENEIIFERLNFSMQVFNRFLNKNLLNDNEFNTAINSISKGFRSLLFDLMCKEDILKEDVF